MRTLEDFEQRLRRELTDEAAENAVVVVEPLKPEPAPLVVNVHCKETLYKWRLELHRDNQGRFDYADLFPTERMVEILGSDT